MLNRASEISMPRKAFLIAAAIVSFYAGGAIAQTATQTTARITIINNLQSSTLTIESSTCSSTIGCTINQNSAVAGKNATESVVTKSSSSGFWNQDWGGTVGTTDYACHFNTSIDSQFTAGACHNITATASQKSGPGGTSHPACNVTVQNPTLADCSNGMVTFTISQ